MNVVIWVVAGALFGWCAYAFFAKNTTRGLLISLIIGVVGAFFGGHVLGPMLGAGAAHPGDFSLFALVTASATAIASLAITDMLYEQFGT